MKMGYERIINDMDAYNANREEAKKVGELLGIILAKHPDERSLRDRLNINSLRKTAFQLAKNLQEIEKEFDLEKYKEKLASMI